MKAQVLLTDTTLRDGEQRSGFAMNTQSKVRLARLLDQAGFCQIEAGIPAMGRCEKDVVCRIMDLRTKAKIAVWNRMRREDIAHSLDCKPDIIHISVPVSDLLIGTMLKKDRPWVAQTLTDCVVFARNKGYEVSVGFQDVSRADAQFIASLAGDMRRLGVLSVRLADTVGTLTPMKARMLLEYLTEQTDIPFGIHTHNDLGMAVAIAAEAVRGGAVTVDTTLFGIGERAGNCDSYKFASAVRNNLITKPAAADLATLRADAEAIVFSTEGAKEWHKYNEGDNDNDNEEITVKHDALVNGPDYAGRDGLCTHTSGQIAV